MVTSDTLLIGWDCSHGKDVSVLIVGRKRPNHSVEIVNAFQGEEAEALYERLVTRNDNNKDVKEALDFMNEEESDEKM